MSRKSKQSSFEGNEFKPKYEFGGALNKNSNPKTARSISTKHAMHVVLRSDVAKGPFSLLKKAAQIRSLIDKQANLFSIKVYEKAVVGNHIHLLIYLKTNDYVQGKKALSRFLKALSGLIARLILGKERGRAKRELTIKTVEKMQIKKRKKVAKDFHLAEVLTDSSQKVEPKKFWTYRPYTRVVVGFKRGYQVVKDYVVRNYLEANGVIPYQPRKLRMASG